MGYSARNKGYIYLKPSGKTYVSQHVLFNENLFPYNMYLTAKASPSHSLHNASNPIIVLQPHSKAGISKPKLYTTSTSSVLTQSTKITISDLAWYNAMKLEYNALVTNNIWWLIDLPYGVSIIRYKWVFILDVQFLCIWLFITIKFEITFFSSLQIV